MWTSANRLEIGKRITHTSIERRCGMVDIQTKAQGEIVKESEKFGGPRKHQNDRISLIGPSPP